jgi:hypothetical protein
MKASTPFQKFLVFAIVQPLFIAALLILSACASGGYSRPYIISDTAEEAVSSEPIEKR